jgi:hypothetical protein
MLNPLVDSLANLTMNELEEKIVVLQRRYFMTANLGVQHQIQNFLEIYKEELHTRRVIESQRQKEQQDGENGLDNLIKVS